MNRFFELDLYTRAGRIGMRAYLDALEEEANDRILLSMLEDENPAAVVGLPQQEEEGLALAKPLASPPEVEALAGGVSCRPAAPHPPTVPPADLDPKRFLDDADKREIWRLAEEGQSHQDIAIAMNRHFAQVYNWLWRVRNGRTSVPEDADLNQPAEPPTAEPSTALVPVAPAREVVVAANGERAVAVDQDIREQWLHEIEEKTLQGFVRDQLYERPA